MKPDTTSNINTARVLLDSELDIVAGGIAISQVRVSLAAIHGFNPQPDPPAMPMGTVSLA